MVAILQTVSLILVVLALVPALAHALELPGKLRLTEETYAAVQPIYYPGFTLVGIAEPVAIVSTVSLAILTRGAGTDFWLTLVALGGLLGMHAVYWGVTHPVNNFWLRREELSRLGSRFFSSGSASESGGRNHPSPNWTDLRNRWEYSHVTRAILAFVSFLALAVSASYV